MASNNPLQELVAVVKQDIADGKQPRPAEVETIISAFEYLQVQSSQSLVHAASQELMTAVLVRRFGGTVELSREEVNNAFDFQLDSQPIEDGGLRLVLVSRTEVSDGDPEKQG